MYSVHKIILHMLCAIKGSTEYKSGSVEIVRFFAIRFQANNSPIFKD